MRKLKLQELGRATIEEFKTLDKIQIAVVLDNLRSGMNIGSFFRTSDALALEQIVLTGISGTPPHPEIHKTAIGADRTVNWVYHKDITEAIIALKDQGYTIVIIEQTTSSIPLKDFPIDIGSRYALVFGNEVEGVSSDALQRSDHAIEIEQFGTKHSFNVSVCGGIVLWHFATALREC